MAVTVEPRQPISASVLAEAVMQGPAVPNSEFVRRLREELFYNIGLEIENTIRVAVAVAGGIPRNQLHAVLSTASIGMSDVEVRMALQRLKNLAGVWKTQ